MAALNLLSGYGSDSDENSGTEGECILSSDVKLGSTDTGHNNYFLAQEDTGSSEYNNCAYIFEMILWVTRF